MMSCWWTWDIKDTRKGSCISSDGKQLDDHGIMIVIFKELNVCTYTLQQSMCSDSCSAQIRT